MLKNIYICLHTFESAFFSVRANYSGNAFYFFCGWAQRCLHTPKNQKHRIPQLMPLNLGLRVLEHDWMIRGKMFGYLANQG